MAKDTSLLALSQIIAQARDYLESDHKESEIKDALGALFGVRYHSKNRPRDAFRDAYSLSQKEDGVPYAGVIAPENPPSGAYGGAISTWMPESARRLFPSCDAIFKRYGEVIYAATWVNKGDTAAAEIVTGAYFDLYARER